MTVNNKYTLTKESIIHNNTRLWRIKARKSFGDVRKGDLGGFIESERNLSYTDECWVYNTAKVYKAARVYEYAQVRDNADVFDNAQIRSNAKISGKAKVYGYADISGFAEISGNSVVHDHVSISGRAVVSGHAVAKGQVLVLDGKHTKSTTLAREANIDEDYDSCYPDCYNPDRVLEGDYHDDKLFIPSYFYEYNNIKL